MIIIIIIIIMIIVIIIILLKAIWNNKLWEKGDFKEPSIEMLNENEKKILSPLLLNDSLQSLKLSTLLLIFLLFVLIILL